MFIQRKSHDFRITLYIEFHVIFAPDNVVRWSDFRSTIILSDGILLYRENASRRCRASYTIRIIQCRFFYITSRFLVHNCHNSKTIYKCFRYRVKRHGLLLPMNTQRYPKLLDVAFSCKKKSNLGNFENVNWAFLGKISGLEWLYRRLSLFLYYVSIQIHRP